MKTKEIAEQLLNKLYAENRDSRSQSEFVIGAIDIISKALEEVVNEQKAIDKQNIIDYGYQVMPNHKNDQSMLWVLEDLLKAMEE